MIERLAKRRSGVRVGRAALCAAALVGAMAASWITPPPEAPAPQAAPAHGAAPQAPIPLVPHPRAAAQPSGGIAAGPALVVARWGFRDGGANLPASGAMPAGRPLTLWMVLDGGAAAVDQIRSRGGIAIEVHWTRDSETGPSTRAQGRGAPNLVTRLTIGHAGLANRLAAEVRRTGFFVWHSWAEKSTLSPGPWTVSLTYPDGRPLACGQPPTPCRFRIAVG
jgi:hypothetical protein